MSYKSLIGYLNSRLYIVLGLKFLELKLTQDNFKLLSWNAFITRMNRRFQDCNVTLNAFFKN